MGIGLPYLRLRWTQDHLITTNTIIKWCSILSIGAIQIKTCDEILLYTKTAVMKRQKITGASRVQRKWELDPVLLTM